ncbi:MAG: acyl-CoA dehydrogenase family protein [Thermodesulfobacteriota bacterium]
MHSLLTEEHKAFWQRCLSYAREELAPLGRQLGELYEVPQELRRSLAESGLYGPLFPASYGGSGVSPVRICLAREALAWAYGPADTTYAMQGLGSQPIVLASSDLQRNRYLPALASGERLTTFALTEPSAGSDVGSLQSTAQVVEGGFLLNGLKRFISNGHSADMAIVFASTPTPENPRALSAFILEKGMKGFEVLRRLQPTAGHDLVELRLQDVRVPAEALLGSLGQGFSLAMQTLELMRVSVGAAAVGMAQAAVDEALAWAKSRVQFARPIAHFQGVSFQLADSATELEAARALVYLAALKKEKGAQEASAFASMAKLFATEAAFRCIDRAVQIHGGMGVLRGSRVEALYREIRPLRIYEGTSEIQRLIISRKLLVEKAK